MLLFFSSFSCLINFILNLSILRSVYESVTSCSYIYVYIYIYKNCRWGEWMYSALSTFNTMTEVPLSKSLNPQLLPGCRSINGCPLLRVCVHCVCVFTAVCVYFGWVICRAQILSMGHHTWPYVTSLSLFSLNKLNQYFKKAFCFYSGYLGIILKWVWWSESFKWDKCAKN